MSDPVSDLKHELLAAARRQSQGQVVGRRRLRERLSGTRLLLASTAVAIAAVLAFVVASLWSSSPRFLERAEAALTPPADTILHQKWEATSISTDPACTVTHGPNEIWIDQTPPHRYRALLTFPQAPDTLPALLCRSRPASELGGTFDTGPISLFGGTNLSALDPVAELREAISAGAAHDEGKTEVGGRTVERIRIDARFVCFDPTCPREPRYAYVDPDTFYPVETRGFMGISPPAGGPVVWFRVVTRILTFEFLPRTVANLTLTDSHANP